MKKLYALLVLILTISCQSEDNTVTQNLDSALTKSAPLSMLVTRVAQYPTHYDNILDGSDCYSVKLPVTISVNGDVLTIENEGGLSEVFDNISSSGSDDDIISFNFPVVIIFPDFHQETVGNQSALDVIGCSGHDYPEIRCVDFVFPLGINTYNTSNQMADMISINNDSELYNFIRDAGEQEVFTIVYPVTLTLSGGQDVTVLNNNDLESVIDEAIDDCSTPIGAEPGPMNLSDILADGSWRISYCEGNDPEAYADYTFIFLDNGTVIVSKNNVTSYGTWELYQDGSHEKIYLNFTDQVLQDLEDDWRVTEYNASDFRLKEDHSGSGRSGGDINYVYFTKNS